MLFFMALISVYLFLILCNIMIIFKLGRLVIKRNKLHVKIPALRPVNYPGLPLNMSTNIGKLNKIPPLRRYSK